MDLENYEPEIGLVRDPSMLSACEVRMQQVYMQIRFAAQDFQMAARALR